MSQSRCRSTAAALDAARRAGRIRVGVVSRERLIKDALRLLVASDDGIAVVDDRADEQGRRPDVILLDMPAGEMEGLDLLGVLHRSNPETRVLALTAGHDDGLVARALRAGARGCVSREAGVTELVKAIRRVSQGDIWAKRRVLVRCLGEDSPGPNEGGDRGGLTRREREILRQLASGRTNKEIAGTLVISEKTVKAHLGHIFRKLHVTGRVQAVLCAMREGLG